MSKSKQSLFNAVSALLLTQFSGLFGLIVIRKIIDVYGSDFNGLNSTAGQFINMLLVVEGGFTIAANVALFKPISSGNTKKVNGILSATRKTFNKIGYTFLAIGLISSFIYAFLVTSNLPKTTIFLVFFMTVISTFFNLVYATKYRVLLQSEHKEYILNSIQVLTLIIGQVSVLIVIFFNGHMLLIRFATMLASILNSIIVVNLTKKKYRFINFKEYADYDSIKGTNDVFMQKITSMIYSTIPLLFITGTVGTIYASVYVVYNSVFRIIKSAMYAFVNAPRMGFGKLIAEKDSNYVYKVFIQYEFIVIYSLLTILSVATVLIMPFIELYTQGITDVNYYNWQIAIILIATTLFEVIHIPSGNIINMSGRFKVGRKIQTIGSITLVILMIIGNYLLGFYGIILAVLITAFILGFIEIYYIHQKYFKRKMKMFLTLLLPNLVGIIPIIIIELKILPSINSYLDFVLIGMFLFFINSIVLALLNLIINKRIVIDLFELSLKIVRNNI